MSMSLTDKDGFLYAFPGVQSKSAERFDIPLHLEIVPTLPIQNGNLSP
jgi:hypothetical protein